MGKNNKHKGKSKIQPGIQAGESEKLSLPPDFMGELEALKTETLAFVSTFINIDKNNAGWKKNLHQAISDFKIDKANDNICNMLLSDSIEFHSEKIVQCIKLGLKWAELLDKRYLNFSKNMAKQASQLDNVIELVEKSRAEALCDSLRKISEKIEEIDKKTPPEYWFQAVLLPALNLLCNHAIHFEEYCAGFVLAGAAINLLSAKREKFLISECEHNKLILPFHAQAVLTSQKYADDLKAELRDLLVEDKNQEDVDKLKKEFSSAVVRAFQVKKNQELFLKGIGKSSSSKKEPISELPAIVGASSQQSESTPPAFLDLLARLKKVQEKVSIKESVEKIGSFLNDKNPEVLAIIQSVMNQFLTAIIKEYPDRFAECVDVALEFAALKSECASFLKIDKETKDKCEKQYQSLKEVLEKIKNSMPVNEEIVDKKKTLFWLLSSLKLLSEHAENSEEYLTAVEIAEVGIDLYAFEFGQQGDELNEQFYQIAASATSKYLNGLLAIAEAEKKPRRSPKNKPLENEIQKIKKKQVELEKKYSEWRKIPQRLMDILFSEEEVGPGETIAPPELLKTGEPSSDKTAPAPVISKPKKIKPVKEFKKHAQPVKKNIEKKNSKVSPEQVIHKKLSDNNLNTAEEAQSSKPPEKFGNNGSELEEKPDFDFPAALRLSFLSFQKLNRDNKKKSNMSALPENPVAAEKKIEVSDTHNTAHFFDRKAADDAKKHLMEFWDLAEKLVEDKEPGVVVHEEAQENEASAMSPT